jgi:hypothetical protein
MAEIFRLCSLGKVDLLMAGGAAEALPVSLSCPLPLRRIHPPSLLSVLNEFWFKRRGKRHFGYSVSCFRNLENYLPIICQFTTLYLWRLNTTYDPRSLFCKWSCRMLDYVPQGSLSVCRNSEWIFWAAAYNVGIHCGQRGLWSSRACRMFLVAYTDRVSSVRLRELNELQEDYIFTPLTFSPCRGEIPLIWWRPGSWSIARLRMCASSSFQTMKVNNVKMWTDAWCGPHTWNLKHFQWIQGKDQCVTLAHNGLLPNVCTGYIIYW